MLTRERKELGTDKGAGLSRRHFPDQALSEDDDATADTYNSDADAAASGGEEH